MSGHTRTYGEPRKPFIDALPDLADATDDQILDLAANALRLPGDLHALCGSSAHVGAVLRQVERLDGEAGLLRDQLAAAQGVGAALERKLATERELRIAAETDGNRLRERHADLSRQLAETSQRLLAAAFNHASLSITHVSYQELTARWREEDRLEQLELERRQIAAERASRVRAAYRSPELVFDVSDVGGGR